MARGAGNENRRQEKTSPLREADEADGEAEKGRPRLSKCLRSHRVRRGRLPLAPQPRSRHKGVSGER